MQLCVHCFIKINHLDKDILRRIYIEQLQKQASVCEAVMQPDHTASLNHRAGGGGFTGAHRKDAPLTVERRFTVPISFIGLVCDSQTGNLTPVLSLFSLLCFKNKTKQEDSPQK